ncbi:MAG: hypothetical protein V3W34_04620 [Phycisphaerae bacterium]
MAPLGTCGLLASFAGGPIIFGKSITAYRAAQDRTYAVLALVVSAGVIVAVVKNFVLGI